MTVLKEYVAAVTSRSAEYQEAEDYYEGNVAETFATTKLRLALRATKHHGQHNYCKVVVDSVVNRLEIANILADNPEAQEIITKVWNNNELTLEMTEVHRRALEYGDCYAMVWPGDDGELLISYNSPLTTSLVYDPENPRKKLYAVKMWQTTNPLSVEKTRTRMNVYTEDKIFRYYSDHPYVNEATDWVAMEHLDNPFGEIPVFHFRTHRPYGVPEAKAGFGVQNDINKLLATHSFTIDYQGAPQRWALVKNSGGDVVDFGEDETERENLGGLKSDPGSMWTLDGIDKVGQFEPADPEVFWKPIRSLKESMAALTDTPFHYLERGFAGISGGEALRVSEAPLLKKVADRQLSFGTTWKELFKFVLKAEGVEASIEVKWNIVESLDALARWDVMLKKINAGLSHRQALREAGYEEEEIERIMAERAQEAAEGAYYQRKPEVRVSTEDNETFDNRNGLTEGAKDNGGRGEE